MANVRLGKLSINAKNASRKKKNFTNTMLHRKYWFIQQIYGVAFNGICLSSTEIVCYDFLTLLCNAVLLHKTNISRKFDHNCMAFGGSLGSFPDSS